MIAVKRWSALLYYSIGVCIMICVEESSTETVHNVSWNLQHLNSIGNQISVTIGDEVRLLCDDGASESARYADDEDQFNSCVPRCAGLLGACTQSNDVIVVPIKAIILDCQPSFPENTIKYILNADTTSCGNGFRLKVVVNSEMAPTDSSPTTSGPVNSVVPTSVSGGINPLNTAAGTEATPTSSGGSPYTNSSSILLSSFSCCTGTNSDRPDESVSVTPTSDGTGETGKRIFLDWTSGAQIGSIVGVVAVLLSVICISVVIFAVLFKLKNKSKRSSNFSNEFPRDTSTTLMLDECTDGKPGKFAPSGNSVAPESIKSPSRPPPDPPKTVNKTNGVAFSNKEGKESVSLGNGTKRTAPPPPRARVLQSVQNYDRKQKPASSAMKSV